MELPKLIILLCCLYHNLASEHSHTIPVEGYETELQELGEDVVIPETPVKVVKITKTIAVKIPVPYPVKVVEKVPYPVHVSKPYPVPVPQIVHVPHPAKAKPLHGHEANDAGYQNAQEHDGHYGGDGQEGLSYQVQESPSYDTSSGGQSYFPSSNSHSYNGNFDHSRPFGSNEAGYSSENGNGAPQNFNGYSGDNESHGSFESKSYDQAIKQYLHKHQPHSIGGGLQSGFHYH